MNLLGATAASVVALMFASGCAAIAQETPSAPFSAVADHQEEPEITHLDIERPTHILFVGNSYFYYNDSLHNHVERMAVAAGLFEESDLTYKSATISGAMLSDHNIDHFLDPANLRVDRAFEVVILQGGSGEPLSAERRTHFANTAELYARRVRAAGGEPVLYMTHAYVPPHPRYRPDMIRDIASLYIETGNHIDALVVPVGLAFEEAYRRRPDIQLHTAFDGTHPSMLGTYLAACTVFASVYGVSPVGNGYNYFGEVPADDALFLQEVAQDTVVRFYDRGGE
jgi:hypothetical protein